MNTKHFIQLIISQVKSSHESSTKLSHQVSFYQVKLQIIKTVHIYSLKLHYFYTLKHCACCLIFCVLIMSWFELLQIALSISPLSLSLSSSTHRYTYIHIYAHSGTHDLKNRLLVTNNESETLAKMQPRLFLGMYMSQTVTEKYNNNERGTFKIYRMFVFGSSSFSQCKGNFYTSIKISIFKILRRLDTTWNFAHRITSSTHVHKHREHYLCTQSFLKRKFSNNSP